MYLQLFKASVILAIFSFMGQVFAYGSYTEIDKFVTGDNIVHGSAWSSDYGFNKAYPSFVWRPVLPKIHSGMDISTPIGTTIKSLTSGRVVRTKSTIGAVYIKPDNQSGTLVYMHLSRIYVRKGQRVSLDQLIGLSGEKATEGAPHLHLSWLKDESSYPREISSWNQGSRTTTTDVTYDLKNLKKHASSSTTSVFDGAGSLIDPFTNCFGCNKDIAQMHPHGNSSTVVFQWLFNDDSCQFLDLTSTSILPVSIRLKKWNDHLTKTAFETTLSSNPISINSEGLWTTFAVTSQEPLSEAIKIKAACRTSDESYSTGVKKNIDKDLVDVGLDYYWTGTGSLISRAESRVGFGVSKDYAVTFSKNKSLTSFQWFSSSSCNSVIVRDASDPFGIKSASVQVKEWDNRAFVNQCTSLPCSINNKSPGWYVIKIKSQIGSTSGTLETICN